MPRSNHIREEQISLLSSEAGSPETAPLEHSVCLLLFFPYNMLALSNSIVVLATPAPFFTCWLAEMYDPETWKNGDLERLTTRFSRSPADLKPRNFIELSPDKSLSVPSSPSSAPLLSVSYSRLRRHARDLQVYPPSSYAYHSLESPALSPRYLISAV